MSTKTDRLRMRPKIPTCQLPKVLMSTKTHPPPIPPGNHPRCTALLYCPQETTVANIPASTLTATRHLQPPSIREVHTSGCQSSSSSTSIHPPEENEGALSGENGGEAAQRLQRYSAQHLDFCSRRNWVTALRERPTRRLPEQYGIGGATRESVAARTRKNIHLSASPCQKETKPAARSQRYSGWCLDIRSAGFETVLRRLRLQRLPGQSDRNVHLRDCDTVLRNFHSSTSPCQKRRRVDPTNDGGGKISQCRA